MDAKKNLGTGNSYCENFQVAQFNFNTLVHEERLLRRLKRKVREKRAPLGRV
jgi:hypothetical protein